LQDIYEDGSGSEVMENLDEASDETYLEQLYLHNRGAFGKDARKTQTRADMRKATGKFCCHVGGKLCLHIIRYLQGGRMTDLKIGPS
jgi:hypothetical protein